MITVTDGLERAKKLLERRPGHPAMVAGPVEEAQPAGEVRQRRAGQQGDRDQVDDRLDATSRGVVPAGDELVGQPGDEVGRARPGRCRRPGRGRRRPAQSLTRGTTERGSAGPACHVPTATVDRLRRPVLLRTRDSLSQLTLRPAAAHTCSARRVRRQWPYRQGRSHNLNRPVRSVTSGRSSHGPDRPIFRCARCPRREL